VDCAYLPPLVTAPHTCLLQVRALGMEMGLPRSSVFRHPFPGPGLAIRVLGKVSKESCDILRLADKIYLDELHASGEYDKIG